MSKIENMNSKRFVLRKSLIGKNQIIDITFGCGKKVTYNHDIAYEIMKDNLVKINCWEKYKSYTCTKDIPVVLRNVELV